MGYGTRYSLSVSSDDEAQAVFLALTAIRDAGYALDLRVPSTSYDTRQPAKWYDHERDMNALSKQFPSVLFTLEGIGESREELDRWRKYYQNGRSQVCRAVAVYPDFDPTWGTGRAPE